MAEVSIRDLRNHGGDVIDRVARGELITVTRSGKPVAELRPLRREPLERDLLIERWRRLPKLDPKRLRADIDSTLGSTL